MMTKLSRSGWPLLCVLGLGTAGMAVAAPAPGTAVPLMTTAAHQMIPAKVKLAGSVAHALRPADWQMVQDAPDGFVLGDAAGKKAPITMTVFLDPNCSICHRLYDQLQPLIQAGQVAVRVLPVGVIRPSSPGKAAHIELPFVDAGLHQTPAALLAMDESGYQKGAAGGHISPVRNADALKVVNQHNAVLERLTSLYAGFPPGRVETPVVVVDDHGVHRVIFGAPPQGAEALLKALTESPAKPALKK